jgi:hypothetical protein
MSQNNSKDQGGDARLKPDSGESTQPQQVLKAPYEPPRIASSRIFHKVLLASPQPGIPGCSAY